MNATFDPGMHAEVETITPEMAAIYLATMVPNRGTRVYLVQRYADDIRAGRWLLTGETIKFDAQGRLFDGQHRLKAIILAQMSIMVLVCRGASLAAMDAIDSGAARSLGDTLHLLNHKNTSSEGATAKIIWNYAAGVSYNYPARSKQALLAFILNHPEISPSVAYVARIKGLGEPIPPSPLSALICLAGKDNSARMKEFAEGCVTGALLAKGDPRLTFNHWLGRLRRTKVNQGGISQAAFMALIRAWNAFANGGSLELIRLPDSPTRELLPIHGYSQRDWPDVPDLKERP